MIAARGRRTGPKSSGAIMAPGMDALSHIDEQGRGRMVDVGGKALTERVAVAGAKVRMLPATRALALGGGGPKGPVLEVARLAGIGAAKRTAELIPLCHPLPLDAIDVSILPEGDDTLAIEARVATTWRTGVEMEAFTAAALAALTLVDMLKAVEKTLVVTDLRLLSKSGGRSGAWKHSAGGPSDGKGPGAEHPGVRRP
jgi:cyclic pyranopterin monophosphate synthase